MLNHTIHAIGVLSYDTFYLQAKVTPLKIVLVEIILPKIKKWELEYDCPGWKIFDKLIRGGASIRYPRVDIRVKWAAHHRQKSRCKILMQSFTQRILQVNKEFHYLIQDTIRFLYCNLY